MTQEISHAGVKGMKWGVRKASGYKSAAKGAILDRNQREAAVLKRAASGKSTRGEKIAMAPDKILMGKKLHNKLMNHQLKKVEAQTDRIKSGKATVSDKMDAVLGVSTLELMVSITDQRG